MVDKQTRRTASHSEAMQEIREGEAFALNLPLIGEVTIPPPDQLAYYGGLALLATLELIDWPVALVIATGHLMASNHRSRIVEELGAALEDAE